jgi:hypothetical protein
MTVNLLEQGYSVKAGIAFFSSKFWLDKMRSP